MQGKIVSHLASEGEATINQQGQKLAGQLHARCLHQFRPSARARAREKETNLCHDEARCQAVLLSINSTRFSAPSAMLQI